MNKPEVDDSDKFQPIFSDASDIFGDEWHANGITRRNFISGLGALFLAGCGGGDMAPASASDGSPATAALPVQTPALTSDRKSVV